MSRARRAGLTITPRAVFQHQTVEALAAVAGGGGGGCAGAGGGRSGAACGWATCRRRRSCAGCRSVAGRSNRFSQAMLLSVPAGLRQEHLGAALAALLDHHDALRLRLETAPENATGGAAGEWSLAIAPRGAIAGEACLRRVDARGLDAAQLRELIAAEADAAEGRLDPAAGVMVQAVWFDAGAVDAGSSVAFDPSSCGGRGVVADPGAGSGFGVAGDRCGSGGVAAAAGHAVPALGAAPCGACAGDECHARSFRSGAANSASLRCCWWKTSSMRCETAMARRGV